jgi:hypothetical protein
LSKDPKFRDCSKHIEIQYHYLHEQVEAKSMSLVCISTKSMFGDVLPKALHKPKHCYCHHMLDLTTFLIEERKLKIKIKFNLSFH